MHSTKRVYRSVALWGAIACLGACSSSNGSSSTSGSDTITIQNMTFSPAELEVVPGATVTVQNEDSVSHSVTSEASMNAYVAGAVDGISFDTGAFPMGTKTFTIPTTAKVGTTIPFFCSVHRSAMPQGTIVIKAPPVTTGTTTGSGYKLAYLSTAPNFTVTSTSGFTVTPR
jgi:plastocyanin